jgi:hypothetical protein
MTNDIDASIRDIRGAYAPSRVAFGALAEIGRKFAPAKAPVPAREARALPRLRIWQRTAKSITRIRREIHAPN